MAKRARIEGQVWEVVNRERRKKRYANDGIEMGDWVDYFMGLLGGVEGRVVRGMRGERKGDVGGITRKEVRRAIRRVKVGKAVGGMGFPEKYGGLEGKGWKEWGRYAIEYGKGRSGLRTGMRV